ncbi:MAG: hypothetical protein XD95_0134 [Microgenomates bacterium 39_7]|nr:MAG: hypothetical protein XD95_0134 [Microgenomates bacterium 39_7]
MKFCKFLLSFSLLILILFSKVSSVRAADTELLGIHILAPHDLEYALNLLKTDSNKDKWHYVTVPFVYGDLEKFDNWQSFFDHCRKNKIIPIVRLATAMEGDSWAIPNRRQIVQAFEFFNQLSWPSDERLIIVYNEVNHSKEWGGIIDPIGYTQTLEFVANWAHTEAANYKVLPAAMDLAAPNSRETMEAFNYLSQMLTANPWIFDHIDYWNSHSYPNPAFSASPSRTGQNSLRGFEYELRFLKDRTGRDYLVFITETGWVDNRYTRPWLLSYYTYALQHIWSHPQVKGVTPFLLRGAPGPFKSFSFFDESNNPTQMFRAFQESVKGLSTEGEE